MYFISGALSDPVPYSNWIALGAIRMGKVRYEEVSVKTHNEFATFYTYFSVLLFYILPISNNLTIYIYSSKAQFIRLRI